MRRLLAIRWSVEEYFKKHAGDYDQPLEISDWEALSRIKSVLEWPMGATLKLESEKVVTARSTLKVFTKLLNQLRGIGRGQEDGYESRTVMVLANGMYNKLREELEDDRALLFGYIFMVYLDIGGEHRFYCHSIQEYGLCFPRKLCEALRMEIVL